MASSKKPRPSELSQRLTQFLDANIRPNQTLLVGLSGGLDSCVLLHLLVTARARHFLHLKAVHVNHGISPNAENWARFCAELCAAHDVAFALETVTVPRDSGLGIEAAARKARYAALRKHKADALMLAHHRDDQAETVLLQLLRGSGVRGLAAMPAIADFDGLPVFRPLLDVARGELENYAQIHGLRWIEDESNLDLAYDRNFLRHHVLPEIEKRFPAAKTTLARSAGHFAEAANLLDEIAAADAARYIDDAGFKIAALRELSLARGCNLLRHWLARHLPEPPSTRRLREISRQLLIARPDAQLRVEVGDGAVRRYRDHAVFVGRASLRSSQSAPLAVLSLPLVGEGWGEGKWQLPHGTLTFTRKQGQGLSANKIPDQLEIRARSGGERFRPDAARPTRSLRNLLQESGIPPWQRDALPLIYAGERLAAIPGIGVACDLQAAPDEAGWVIEFKRDLSVG
ncbi:MAG: tRNA lysidine(34) synthetase TilS [Methylobacillus sp.]|jgi:tRNA(Ile)-lysidine synthase|nr:tRNA lysidine(34) synthetase TilS [Methylobacillus sp.]